MTTLTWHYFMVFTNTCLNCQLIHTLGNLARGRGEETHSQMVGWGAWAQTEGALSLSSTSDLQAHSEQDDDSAEDTHRFMFYPIFLYLPSPGDQADRDKRWKSSGKHS